MARDIRISVNLVDAVPVHLDFLNYIVSREGEFDDERVLHRSIYRYENYWLPLLSDSHIADIAPPRDVKYIWYLHMLSPKNYSNYCFKRFGRLLPNKLRLSGSQEKYAMDRTAAMWNDKYLNEKYNLYLGSARDSGSYRRSLNNEMFGIVERAKQQKLFHYQVSLPHYRDSVFLENAFKRYRQFLHICKLHTSNVVKEPPYDVELMWRVHMLHPKEYNLDVTNAAGFLVDTEEQTSNMYDSSGISLSAAWEAMYGEPMLVSGSGYRGSPPSTISPFPSDISAKEIIDNCELSIDDICVTQVWSNDKKFVIDVKRLGDTSFSYNSICRINSELGQTISSKHTTGLGTIHFDSKYHRGLEFHIYSIKGKFCSKKERHLATVFYSVQGQFPNGSFFTRTMQAEVPRVSTTDPAIKFTLQVKAAEKKPHVLSMTRDPFVVGDVTQDLQPFVINHPSWEEVLSSHIEGNHLLVARHGMKEKEGTMGFGCQVVKNEMFNTKAVLVYLNNRRLVSVGHTIGAGDLPQEDQVKNGCPIAMDAGTDHAMIIKNDKGDWATLVARWESTKPGEGQVHYTFYNLQTKETSTFELKDDEMQSFKFDHITVNMPTGRMTIANSGKNSIGDDIALSFCVGMLFVMCQKKAIMLPALSRQSLKNGHSAADLEAAVATASKSRYSRHGKMSKKKTQRRKMSASFTFLLACGLQMDSYSYMSSGQTSRNSTINLGDLNAVIAAEKGDVNFTSRSNGYHTGNGRGDNFHDMMISGYQSNGHIETVPPPPPPQDDADQYMDIKL